MSHKPDVVCRNNNNNKQTKTADAVRKILQNFQTNGEDIFMDRKKSEYWSVKVKQTRWRKVALKYQC
jgi:hypothetical protein